MKICMILTLLMFSSIAFSQSLIVLKNGKVITVSNDGYHYDNGNFLLPYKIKHMGGNFIIDGRKAIKTVDNNGVFYKFDDQDLPITVGSVGANYFTSKTGRIYTVNKNGNLYRGDREKVFRKIKKKGGNFLVVETKKNVVELLVVNEDGIILNVKAPFLDPAKIYEVGGNFFTDGAGNLYSLDTKGYVYSVKNLGTKFLGFMEKGGNFIIYKKKLYTISATGLVSEQNTDLINGTPRFLGTNFFLTDDNMIHIIDTYGNVKTSRFPFDISDVSLVSKYE